LGAFFFLSSGSLYEQVFIEPNVMSPPEPPPIVLTKPKPRRFDRAVPRPWPVNIALLFIWLWLTVGGVGTCFSLTFVGAMVGNLIGVAPSTISAWAIISLLFWPIFNFLFVWFLGILFDSLTEYRTQIVAEGTARALAKEER
jgi:hypothetical protein